MEESLTYGRHARIEPGTRKLIVNMINSILSAFPAGSPSKKGQSGCTVRAENLENHARQVIRMAEQHPEILSGLFNVNDLKRLLRQSLEYLEIHNRLRELLDTVTEQCQSSSLETIQMANRVREHLEMVVPDEGVDAPAYPLTVVHKNPKNLKDDPDSNLKVMY